MPNTPANTDRFINPFETRWIRPDEMGFLCPAGQSIPNLLHQICAEDQTYEIIGPHGAGKTTLAHSLLQHARDQGITGKLIRCGKSRISKRLFHPLEPGSLVILDEYEQLSFLQRRKAQRLARGMQLRLVLIGHQTHGFQPLLTLMPDLETMQTIVARLQQNQSFVPLITEDDIARLFSQHAPDCREMLFACYDLYHQRRNKKPAING